jgi:hypothetical protein
MCWKNKEVGGVKRSSSDETWNGFKFLLRMWSTIGCHMSIQHEFNNNGVDHSCRLEKKKWTSLWKAGEKQNELSFLMKHFQIGTKIQHFK